MEDQNNTVDETQTAFAFKLAKSIEAFMDHHNGDLKMRYYKMQAGILDFNMKLKDLVEIEKSSNITNGPINGIMELFEEHFKVKTDTEGLIESEDGKHKE